MAEEITIQETAPLEGAKKPGRRSDEATLSEYIESLLVTVILALFGTTFIVQAFKIPSASMEGTLLVGDHLLVNKFIFGGRGAWYEKVLPYRPLERGDIIVFKYPYLDHQHFVKRVIGLPGDRLKVEDQRVYVNGREYFAMGDNRDHSLDSRYWGFVDRDAIMGRPFLVYWSVEASSADYGQSSFLQRLKSVVDTLLHLPQRTRWSRMLRIVH